FAGATILHKEYRQLSPWISVAGFGVAAFTGVDRVLRNRHHWGDVVAGAAIGVLGTELGYWIGDRITGDRSRYAVGADANGVMVSIRF
ncbi:MAG: phosphatase PAP2 family protein, partial [Prevotella sp.]|nr:phosphatase PAP2 family protein [Prevotella sp.]